jgi:hypothetical protein
VVMESDSDGRQRMAKRCDALIEKAVRLLENQITNVPIGGRVRVNPQEYAGWQVQSVALLEDAVGSGHPYAKAFPERADEPFSMNVQTGLGILRALKEDFENNYWRSPSR